MHAHTHIKGYHHADLEIILVVILLEPGYNILKVFKYFLSIYCSPNSER